MAKLYKKVPLLVSRHYDHGGDGLERGPVGFFRSIEEYNELAKKHNWENGPSFKSSWWVRPKEIEAHVDQKAFAQFLAGKPLRAEHVLFSADKVAEVHAIGGW